MSLAGASGELSNTLKKVRENWEELSELWQDSVREEFSERHWSPLVQQTNETLRAMDELNPILQTIRRECGT